MNPPNFHRKDHHLKRQQSRTESQNELTQDFIPLSRGRSYKQERNPDERSRKISRESFQRDYSSRNEPSSQDRDYYRRERQSEHSQRVDSSEKKVVRYFNQEKNSEETNPDGDALRKRKFDSEFESIHNKKIKEDSSATLIPRFYQNEDLNRGLELLDEMKLAGIKPDTHAYNRLISIAGKNGNMDIVRDLQDEMVLEGVISNEGTHKIVSKIEKQNSIELKEDILQLEEEIEKAEEIDLIYNDIKAKVSLERELDLIRNQLIARGSSSKFHSAKFEKWFKLYADDIQKKMASINISVILHTTPNSSHIEIFAEDDAMVAKAQDFLDKLNQTLTTKVVKITFDQQSTHEVEKELRLNKYHLMKDYKIELNGKDNCYTFSFTGFKKEINKQIADLKKYEKNYSVLVKVLGKNDWFYDNEKSVLIEPWKSTFDSNRITLKWPKNDKNYFFIIGPDQSLIEKIAEELRLNMKGHEITKTIDVPKTYVPYIDAFVSTHAGVKYKGNQLIIVGKPSIVTQLETDYKNFLLNLFGREIKEVKYSMTKSISYFLTHEGKNEFKTIQKEFGVELCGLLGMPWRIAATMKSKGSNQTIVSLKIGNIPDQASPKICTHRIGATDVDGEGFTTMEKLGVECKEKVRLILKDKKAGDLFEEGITRGRPVWHLVYDEKLLEDPTPLFKSIIQKSNEEYQKAKVQDKKNYVSLAIPPIGITRFSSKETITKFNLALMSCLKNEKHHLKDVQLTSYDPELCKMFAEDFNKNFEGEEKLVSYATEKTYRPQPLKDSNKLFFYKDKNSNNLRAFSPLTNNFICWNLENGKEIFKVEYNGDIIDFNIYDNRFVCKQRSELKSPYEQDLDPPYNPDEFEVSLIGRDPEGAWNAISQLIKKFKE